MKFAIDLHIHSGLSACASNEMTPNNIINMAWLKGLDFIAVTDHNAVENLEVLSACASKQNIILVPGMELETSEEVHLVCLFHDISTAIKMQEWVYAALPAIKNREDIFGEQLVFNEEDEVVRKQDKFLLTATALGIEEVYLAVSDLGGVVLPAHVDRDSYSMLSNLGAIPDNLGIRYIELSRKCNVDVFLKQHPELCAFSILQSSDAHYLEDILERESFIELEEKSIVCLIEKLKQGV